MNNFFNKGAALEVVTKIPNVIIIPVSIFFLEQEEIGLAYMALGISSLAMPVLNPNWANRLQLNSYYKIKPIEALIQFYIFSIAILLTAHLVLEEIIGKGIFGISVRSQNQLEELVYLGLIAVVLMSLNEISWGCTTLVTSIPKQIKYRLYETTIGAIAAIIVFLLKPSPATFVLTQAIVYSIGTPRAIFIVLKAASTSMGRINNSVNLISSLKGSLIASFLYIPAVLTSFSPVYILGVYSELKHVATFSIGYAIVNFLIQILATPIQRMISIDHSDVLIPIQLKKPSIPLLGIVFGLLCFMHFGAPRNLEFITANVDVVLIVALLLPYLYFRTLTLQQLAYFVRYSSFRINFEFITLNLLLVTIFSSVGALLLNAVGVAAGISISQFFLYLWLRARELELNGPLDT